MSEEKTTDERLEVIEYQVFNHIPGQIKWAMRLITLNIMMIAVVIALVAIAI